MRFCSLQRFGLGKAHNLWDLPHLKGVTIVWFDYHFNAFPTPKPWGFISYLNAHEIRPLEFFPLFKANRSFDQFLSSPYVRYLSWTIPERLGLINITASRVLSSQRVRTYPIQFYSDRIAVTLLSFLPFRVFSTSEMEQFSLFLLSQA